MKNLESNLQLSKYFYKNHIKRYVSQLPVSTIKYLQQECIGNRFILVYALGNYKKFEEWKTNFKNHTVYYNILGKIKQNIISQDKDNINLFYIDITGPILRIEMNLDSYNTLKNKIIKLKLDNLISDEN